MPIPMLDSPDIEVIRTQFDAWMRGAIARARGDALPDNPHSSRSAAADAWENGWEVIDLQLDTAARLAEDQPTSEKGTA